MENSSIYLFLFFTFLIIHGVVELQASQEVSRSLQTSQSTSRSQPYRTGFHFQPPKNWMKEPMIYKGIYHLFYQYNPKGAVWGNIVWGHTTSTDLVHWTPHDQAIYPSQPSDINGCWSGSTTILPGNKPAILYTGIDPKNRQVQKLAVPKDLSDPYLREWVKSPKNPLISPIDQIDPSFFRDPTTAWLGPDTIWRVIIGSQIGDKGLAVLYRSKDFVKWDKATHPLYSVRHTGMWECPDFFAVVTNSLKGADTLVIGPDVKHVLKASIGQTRSDCYTIGTYNVTTDKYVPQEGVMNGVTGLSMIMGNFMLQRHSLIVLRSDGFCGVGLMNDLVKMMISRRVGLDYRSIWLDKSGKQLIQWPIEEIERLRQNQVKFPRKLLEGGSLLEVTGFSTSQADVEISFQASDFSEAEVPDPSQTNPQLLCSQKGASVKSALVPFGLLVLASKDLREYTAVFFRIFKAHHKKYVVLMCSDQSRSSLNNENDKTTYGAFLNVDPDHEKLSLRSLIDHSIVESFGGGGKTCITAGVYPTLAIKDKAHLYAFNNGTQNVKITNLSAWSMKKAQMNRKV